MDNENIIGIDLGATNIRGALVSGDTLGNIQSKRIQSHGTAEEVLNDVYDIIDVLISDNVKAIGIGVPGVVDIDEGIVYDVQYIPSWIEVPVKKLLEEKYKIPVFVNNDANCFALGEYYFGKGKESRAMIGLTLGTGLGAGLIINRKLYAGPNCGAGEFGMVPYLDHIFEYYASGQFFSNVYHTNGETVFKQAGEGNKDALQMYKELGTHIGNAIKMIMYTFDPELIVIGGSVRHAFPYFKETMWQTIQTFAYRKIAERLTVKISELENSGLLGAAALYYDYAR